MISLYLSQQLLTFVDECFYLRYLYPFKCLCYYFVYVLTFLVSNHLPSLSFDVILGQADHALHGVVIGAVAGVEDQPDLELLRLLPHRLRPMHRQPVHVDGQFSERVHLSQSSQKSDELLLIY